MFLTCSFKVETHFLGVLEHINADGVPSFPSVLSRSSYLNLPEIYCAAMGCFNFKTHCETIHDLMFLTCSFKVETHFLGVLEHINADGVPSFPSVLLYGPLTLPSRNLLCGNGLLQL